MLMTTSPLTYPLDLATFPSVDELNRAFVELLDSAPGLVTSSVIGRSQLGEPITAFTIGSGSRHAVVAGGVHPNEPIGFHTALHLAHRLISSAELRDKLDLTWHIIPCIDPDGARLNETWFAKPGDRVFYGRNFYRPAPNEQVEWSFPLDYKKLQFDRPIPETQSLMSLFDAVRPIFFIGLHNSELGGVFYYLNRTDAPDLIADLAAIPAKYGLSLDIGEPESPEIPVLGPGVYKMILATEQYDYRESLGLEPQAGLGGGGSADYLQDLETLVLVAELPYWTHPSSTDPTPSTVPYVHALQEKADAMEQTAAILTGVLERVDDLLTINSPMIRAVREFAPTLDSLAEMERKRALDIDRSRIATRAEEFSNADIVHCFRLRYGGSLLRALDIECAAGVAVDQVRRERDAFAEVFRVWSDAAGATPIETIPIADLVGVQLDVILIGATWAARR